MPTEESQVGNRRQLQLVIFSAAVQAVFYARNLLLLPIMTRCLGLELFGVWSKMQALIGILVSLLGLGVVSGLGRYLPSASPRARGPLFWGAVAMVAATGCVLLVILCVASPILGVILYQKEPAAVTRTLAAGLGAVVLVSGLAQLSASFYRLTETAIPYGRIILMQVVGLIIATGVGWSVLGRNLWVPIGAWIVGPGVITGWALWRIGRTTTLGIDRKRVATMVRFGAPLLPAALTAWVIDFADRYLLTLLVPHGADAVVGVYGANYALGGVVVMVFSPFFLFYSPAVTRLWDTGDRRSAGLLTRQMLVYAMVLALPVIVSGVLFGDTVVGLIAGKDFRAHPAVLSLVMVGYYFYMVGAFAQTPVMLQNRTGVVFCVSAVAAVANLGLGYLLIPLASPWGGIRGAAASTAVSFAIFLVGNRLAALPVREFSMGWSKIIRLHLLAASVGLVVWIMGPNTALSWVFSFVLAFVLYGSGIVRLSIIDRDEREKILGAFGDLCRRVTQLTGSTTSSRHH